MRIIDAHVHLYPAEVAVDPKAWAGSHGELHWSQLCTRVRKNGRSVQTFPSVDELLRTMDEAGVEKSVLLGWYWENQDTCEKQNRFYASCVRAYPDRLAAFATIAPRAGRNATAELRRAFNEGLIGLGELSPHSLGIKIDDPAVLEIFAVAEELRLPVNLHVTDPEGRAYPGKVETPLSDFFQIASRFPKVIFILAHWGARLPLRGLGSIPPNIYYDTAASPLLYGPGVWEEMLRAAGDDRILFGSDFPLVLFPATETEPKVRSLVEEAVKSGLQADQLKAVFWGNAQRMLTRSVPAV